MTIVYNGVKEYIYGTGTSHIIEQKVSLKKKNRNTCLNQWFLNTWTYKYHTIHTINSIVFHKVKCEWQKTISMFPDFLS